MARNGGKISPEWFLPKVLEILEEAPAVYEAADKFIEAGDWITWLLTGQERRNSVAAGYRALWDKQGGYPAREFFQALHPRLVKYVEQDLSVPVSRTGTLAGGTDPPSGAVDRFAGRHPRCRDGHRCPCHAAWGWGDRAGADGSCPGNVGLPSPLGSEEPLCSGNLPVSPKTAYCPACSGMKRAKRRCGDHFEWFVKNAIPAEFQARAQAENKSVYALLEEQASRQVPGAAGLIALDWWNGNRSILADGHLGGVLVGASLTTRPADIYRALHRGHSVWKPAIIIENFESHGVQVHDLVASGGLAERNRLLMQIYADVTGRPIRLAASTQASALGAAILAATAAGEYLSLAAATQCMTKPATVVYRPSATHQPIYDQMFAEYGRLHDLLWTRRKPADEKSAPDTETSAKPSHGVIEMTDKTRAIVVGADHFGLPLKSVLCDYLRSKGFTVDDIGVNDPTPVDYPDIAADLAVKVAPGSVRSGNSRLWNRRWNGLGGQQGPRNPGRLRGRPLRGRAGPCHSTMLRSSHWAVRSPRPRWPRN